MCSAWHTGSDHIYQQSHISLEKPSGEVEFLSAILLEEVRNYFNVLSQVRILFLNKLFLCHLY